jgi:hypothetical protein
MSNDANVEQDKEDLACELAAMCHGNLTLARDFIDRLEKYLISKHYRAAMEKQPHDVERFYDDCPHPMWMKMDDGEMRCIRCLEKQGDQPQ